MYWWGNLAIAIAVATSFASNGAQPADRRTVGMATKVVSPAQVENEPAAVGTLAHMNDQLRTGAKARLQISFRDSTELTLGENASLVVDRFIFDPDAGTGEVMLKTGVAAFRMATGKINEMQNKKITVSTPFATLGVRGTDFWSGSVAGKTGVLLVHNSRLEVKGNECPEDGDNREMSDEDRERCRCAVTLDQAEEGTYIDRRTGCPLLPDLCPP